MISNIIEKDNTLILQVEGRIDTINSEPFEKELSQAAASANGRELLLDAQKLTYISSMGLRVLLSLRKKQPYRIINAIPEIYDIFHMTGFDKLIDIEKALRNLDVEGCEIIGAGVNGTVYRLGADQIAKVYNEKVPLDYIKQEHDFAQAAFLSGVPTAISYDTVRCGDKYGIVFEMLNASTFAGKFHGHPDTFSHYAKLYADTLKQVHNAKADTNALPSAADKYNGWIDQSGHLYSERERELMHRMIDSVPKRDTTIHGDFHPKNIMVQGEEPLLVDMADVSYGHPIFDFACSTLTHRIYPWLMPENTIHFMGVSADEITQLWWLLLESYFGTSDKAELEEIDKHLMHYALLRYALQPIVLPQTPEEDVQRTIRIVRERLFPVIEEISGKLFF
ncbi:MAG: phosphotransferase [Bacteroidales bacterium]|nr:phosphotransferase [Bacteroidales bacterium]